MRLENKVVLLSGVGPGMGRAMALLFAQEGACCCAGSPENQP